MAATTEKDLECLITFFRQLDWIYDRYFTIEDLNPEEDEDDKLLMKFFDGKGEFDKSRFLDYWSPKLSLSNGRVVYGYSVLYENCCDRTKTHLDWKPELKALIGEQTCRVCGCTEDDCRQCIAKTGVPCHWVEEDLCSACVDAKGEDHEQAH